MRNVTAGVMVGAMVLSGTATGVQAQTVTAGAGWTTGWDDETNLGKGVLVSGGIAQPLGRHLAVEGEVSWARQLRDSGYLAADGTPLIGTARLAYLFQGPESARGRSRARASVWCTPRDTSPLARFSPARAASRSKARRSQREWSLTQPAFELGAGVAIKSGDRLSFRPEVRWTSTTSSNRPSRLDARASAVDHPRRRHR